LAIALILGTSGIVRARAAPVSDYDWAIWSSCFYDVYAEFDTAFSTPYGKVRGDHSTCAVKIAQSAWFWDPSISDFQDFYYGPAATAGVQWMYFYYTDNVYGYTSIEKPAGTWSAVEEAHAD
jgi:hypothetical protein